MTVFEPGGGLTTKGKVLGALVAFSLVMTAAGVYSAVYFVGAGERGVIFDQRSGTVEQTYGEGFHTKTPFIQDAYQYNVKRQKVPVEGSTFTKDTQRADFKITVHYSVNADDAWWIHQNVGRNYENIVIKPATQQATRDSISQFQAPNLIQNRNQLPPMISERLEPALKNISVDLIGIDIENLDFSGEFEQSVEDKVVAEQEAQKQKRLEVAAGHEANQSVIRAEGEAKAIKVINEQLAASPNYLTYYWIENWDGHTPKVIAGGSSNTSLLIPSPMQGSAGFQGAVE